MVHVVSADDSRVVNLLRQLAGLNESTALITSEQAKWAGTLCSAGIPFAKTKPGDILSPGLYILGDLKGKGLEFKNVVFDYTDEVGEDKDEEKRIRHVHFSLARRGCTSGTVECHRGFSRSTMPTF